MSRNRVANDQISALQNVQSDASLFIKRVTIDFGSLASNGGTDTKTASVPGAVVGDGVAVLSTVDPTADMAIAGWVSAPDVVTLRATNATPSGPYDPPSQDFIIIIAKAT